MSGIINRKGRKNIAISRAAYILAVVALLATVMAGVLGGASATSVAAQGKQFSIGTVVATIVNTNLLDQPAANSAIVSPLPLNARAMVLGGAFNDGWYWLSVGGSKGYVQSDALVVVDANYTPIPLVTPTTPPTDTPVPPTATNSPTPVKPTNTPVPPKPTNTPVPPRATNSPVQQDTATTAPAQPTATATTPVATTAQPATTSTVAQPAATPDDSVPQVAGTYTGLWLAEMSTGGNVRVGPGLDQKILKGWWVGRRVILYQAATDSKGGVWYRVSDPPEDPMWVHSSLISKVAPVQYQGAKYKGRWVDVNIGQQIVTAYENGNPVKVTLASTGKAPNLTEIGVWKIYWRLPKQDMKGGSKASADYYDLKDVPFPQYFHISGEALHGTYWHDDFGHPHSHGCVNLSTPMSEWFYGWDKIGTIVNVHN